MLILNIVRETLLKECIKVTNDLNINFTISIPPDHYAKDFHLSSNILLINQKKLDQNKIEQLEIALNKSIIFSNIKIDKLFLNLKLSNKLIKSFLEDLINKNNNDLIEKKIDNEKINIEILSCNPTGPVHIGHARNAITSDVLANILESTGYNVTREFYINDAGNQVQNLTKSVFLRYKEIVESRQYELEENFYQGEYIKEIAHQIITENGSDLNENNDLDFSKVKKFSINFLMVKIKQSLEKLSIIYDVFTSEQEILDRKILESVIMKLKSQDLVYYGTIDSPKQILSGSQKTEKLLLLRTTKFGDNVDRPLQKSNGEWAYIAPDIAYHYDKFIRGFKKMILILGVDHKGHGLKLTSSINAITNNEADLKIKLYDLVKFIKNGEEVRMSKRSGNFLTMEEAIDEIGQDSLRFFILMQKTNTPINFDFDFIKKQSNDNPIFYVQYAIARCNSVLRSEKVKNIKQDFNLINNLPDKYISIISQLIIYNETIDSVVKTLEPNLLINYITNLASKIHELWNLGLQTKEKFISENAEDTNLNLIMIKSSLKILTSALSLLKIKPVEKM